MNTTEIRHFHLFCGLGGGAKGFNKASPRVGPRQAKFRCLGGIDVDPASIKDFKRLAGVPGTLLDLFDRSQYQDFHGNEPPGDWREAMPQDIQRAAGNERPHIVFLSAPCKGFSGLLAEGKSKTDKYQALNRLTLRGVWLMLEAWADDPPELVVFENVPRIATRGRYLLDQIAAMLQHYGYATSETTHDCGKLGRLAQSRKRFLLVARCVAKVPNFLYEPDSHPLRGVGDVLGRMPLPGDGRSGPMHRVPNLMWKTWLRLAFVEAGGDWRSLNKLAVEDGVLRDYLIVPELRNGMLGVHAWNQPCGTVTGKGRPSNGAFAVADPRTDEYCTTSDDFKSSAGKINGLQIEDPKLSPSANRQYNLYRVIDWKRSSNVVAGSAHVAGGALSVADPRHPGESFSKYSVTPWHEPSGTVISGSTTGQGAFAVADPRTGLTRDKGDSYLTGGHYGVLAWEQSAGAVSSSAGYDNGRWSVADPRSCPASNQHLLAVIRSLDGTWHRPFTTLELAALQSLVDPEDQMELDGLSDQAWRERIGNAVPPDAAQAIAEVMGTTLLLAWSGETFTLSSQNIWVKPIALALCVADGAISS